MSANTEAMIRAAIQAYRNGNKAEARALLDQAIDSDSHNEQAWLWMSAVVETKEEQRTCLENVLVINPGNDRARQGLKSMGFDPDVASAPEPEKDDLFFESTSPFTDTSFADEDPLTTSEEDESLAWDAGIPSSSASSTYQGPQLTSADYDDWMDNLNIGSKAGSGPASDVVHNPFGDVDFDEIEADFEFSPEENLRDTFNPRVSGPFDADIEFDPTEADDYDPLARLNEADSYNYAAANDDDDNYDDDEYSEDDYDNFADAIDLPADDDPDLFSRDRNSMMDFEDDIIDDEDPQVYFSMIPSEIEPTRLPGKRESTPLFLLLLVVVLLAGNIFALVYLIT